MGVLAFGRVVTNRVISQAYREVVVTAPVIARAAAPGQFVMVRCGRACGPLLRRPLSIHDVNEGDGSVHLLFRVAGEGTSILADLGPGDGLDLMGPLGVGFAPAPRRENGRIVLVGGGIGVAPLAFLARRATAEGWHVQAVIGARCRDELHGVDELARLGAMVKVATEDGSVGETGLVTTLLPAVLPSADAVYACGPLGMLRAVACLAIDADVPCQVSMEQRMACGIGACQGCTCGAQLGEGLRLASGTDQAYLRVCRDGPVFWVRKEVTR